MTSFAEMTSTEEKNRYLFYVSIHNSVASFEIFTAMKIHVTAFWVVTPCTDIVGYLHFGGRL